MNQLSELIQSFISIDEWKEFVGRNFSRNSGTYSFVSVTDIEINYNELKFIYPTKVIFEAGFIKQLKSTIRTEDFLVNEKPVTIIERKKTIPLSFYKRAGKYTGETFEIIEDIISDFYGSVNAVAKFSPEILTTGDSPLYEIDSKINWSSYLLILEKQNPITSGKEMPNILNEVLDDYGIHYKYDATLNNLVFIVFPLPYIKVIENKINRGGSKESVRLVLEYNELGIFYTGQLKIEIEATIRDIRNEVIYQKTEQIWFAKSKYQIVEIIPEKSGEIGFASISIKINENIVDKFSGYYIRDIKLDIKAK